MSLHIVLVEPEIPQNTGNISRTCAATGASLHLVGKLGFSTDDKHLKRSGLDYWHLLDLHYHAAMEEVFARWPQGAFYFASTKAPGTYAEVNYPLSGDVFLVFGKETRGLPEELLRAHYPRCIRIPMVAGARSLNLSNSVAIVAYEVLRQQGFPGLLGEGRLTT